MTSKSVVNNATVSNPGVNQISVTRSKSAFRRGLETLGKLAIVATVGTVAGGMTLYNVTEKTAATFGTDGGIVLRSRSEAIAQIQAWKLDVLQHGAIGLGVGVVASTVAGFALFGERNQREDPELKRALINTELNRLIAQTKSADLIEAVATIQVEMEGSK